MSDLSFIICRQIKYYPFVPFAFEIDFQFMDIYNTIKYQL